MQTLDELQNHFPHSGTLQWIGIASKRQAVVESVQEVAVELKTGLAGEHHAMRGNSQRQVTLIQAEHFPVVASLLHREEVRPEQTRRNLMVSGISLQSLKGRQFQIGEVILEGTGNCVPCSRMEEVLGPGGYNAMRGHGGITAIVIQPGTIRVGDAVTVCE